MEDHLTLRPVGRPGDVDLVCAWRNDPVTRDASFDTTERTRDDMEHMLDDWLRADPLPPHLLDHAGEPVAFLRFSRPRLEGYGSDSGIEISIHVAPEVRRRGYAKAALQLADQVTRNAGYRQIVALVKAENAVSRRLFEACGYEATGHAEVHGAGGNGVIVYLRALS